LGTSEDQVSAGFLDGKLVCLRGVRREDMSAYQRWLDNPMVTEYLEMGWRPSTDLDLESAYSSLVGDANNVAFVVVDRESQKPVGVCGLYLISWIARRAQFNILMGEPWSWDRGIGTEALTLLLDYGFNRLNLESVNLGVNCENRRAIRSYEKAGFIVEGQRRKFIYRNGRHYDMIVMSILREEFKGRIEPAQF
jgi:RimJ/RimL family protein N-acetyltransferase